MSTYDHEENAQAFADQLAARFGEVPAELEGPGEEQRIPAAPPVPSSRIVMERGGRIRPTTADQFAALMNSF